MIPEGIAANGIAGVGATLVCTALGIAAAAIVARLQPRRGGLAELSEPQRFAVIVGAVVGAIAGAYVLQFPADWFGWSWVPPDSPIDARPLGGRTVVGGLLGGWIGVEWMKRRRGITLATGDSFAAPLAVALAFGRGGCTLAGCCAGRECAPAWWALADAAYLALYALLRVALEFARPNPPLLLGASWDQLLALVLFALASATWWRRRPLR
ncbi:MAG: hypothetical protein EXS13_13320 [Planctomycetes bacterium]|nr:hypothetical protein [Planctomycetota bacterium]